MPRTFATIVASAFALSVIAAAPQGCGGATTPIGQNGSTLGDIDAGTGLCGSAACAAGQLCCASMDESCSPTCMTVSKCPVYGRPCVAPDAGGGADSGPPGSLHWYATCGDPVCQSPVDGGARVDAGAACPPIGAACGTKGQTCGTRDPQVSCGAIEVCDDHDPRSLGCPISSRRFKDGVSYLDDAALASLHDETLAMRLATYAYKSEYGDPSERHLGFIIEDQPQSMSVDRGHDRVDMYGYLSMVVATMQVQEREIAELRRELRSRGACVTPRE